MGVKLWPLGDEHPFGIKSDHTWTEIGALFRLVAENNVQTFIETGVGRGDLAAWMIAKTNFDPDFSYLGVTNDPNAVDPRIQEKMNTQSFIAVGASCSPIMLRRVGSLIHNSTVALVLCNGLDIEREVDHYLPLMRPGDVIVAHQFLTAYKGRKLMDMSRNGQLVRVVGDWITRTRFIAGVLT